MLRSFIYEKGLLTLHFFDVESKKQKMKNWEDNDYYDSDEDTFLDRTGSSMFFKKQGIYF